VASAEITQAQEEYNETGAVPCPLWRPDPDAGPSRPVEAFGGVGRKP
jgi:hypothetical protein